MTATFDHRLPGTTARAWSTRLDELPVAAPSGVALVLLAAHPDDETLGAGGLLAASAELGADIVLVIATDGEASHPRSPTHTLSELARIRRREVAAAVKHLAPQASIHHLGLPDGGLAVHSDDLVEALLDAIGERPVRLVTPWRGDGHPDHEACAAAGEQVAARRQLEHWQYPIWAWHWSDPSRDDLPLSRIRRVELSDDALAAKQAALAEHASQHSALSTLPGDEAILPVDVLAHFERPYECFVVTSPATRPGYFDALYAESADPWGLADRFYEQRKRAVLLASLPRPRFRRVFEPGCATGLLTKELATRADHVVAWDVAATALEQAANRLRQLQPTRVRVARGRIPDDWPEGSFDLVVLSEVGYYCEDLDLLVRRVEASLDDDGIVVACHWAHAADDHPQRADDVHEALGNALHRDVHHVEADFQLDIWSRRGLSVATAEGII
jgi:LmbE family N-acetylglucosaminyl deacetylase